MPNNKSDELVGINPDLGQSVVIGTHIRVLSVMEVYFGSGGDLRSVLAAFPGLSEEQVLACKNWADSRLAG